MALLSMTTLRGKASSPNFLQGAGLGQVLRAELSSWDSCPLQSGLAPLLFLVRPRVGDCVWFLQIAGGQQAGHLPSALLNSDPAKVPTKDLFGILSSLCYHDHRSLTSGIEDRGGGENVACCFLVLVITHLNKQCFKAFAMKLLRLEPFQGFFPSSSHCFKFLHFHPNVIPLLSTLHPKH